MPTKTEQRGYITFESKEFKELAINRAKEYQRSLSGYIMFLIAQDLKHKPKI